MGYATPLLTERYKWNFTPSDVDIDLDNTEYTGTSSTYEEVVRYNINRLHRVAQVRLKAALGGVADAGQTIYYRIRDQDGNLLLEHSDATPGTSSTNTADITIGDITQLVCQIKTSNNGTDCNIKDIRIMGDLLGQYANIDFPTLDVV